MDYANLKKQMVDSQLIPRGIKNKKVLNAFLQVDRYEFVPADLCKSAYEDCPLPIGEGQTISQPFMVALMTEQLRLTGCERVLEIGTGSGYQTAILASIAKEIYSVERINVLANRAKSVLARLGFTNVKIKTDDGTLGWSENAPYDAIIVTAGAPKIPQGYIEQLKVGGRLVIPVGGRLGQVLTCVEKRKDDINALEVCGCVFVPLLGEEGWKE